MIKAVHLGHGGEVPTQETITIGPSNNQHENETTKVATSVFVLMTLVIIFIVTIAILWKPKSAPKKNITRS